MNVTTLKRADNYVMATVSEALTIALMHHQSGRFQAAEHLYRQVLAAAPNQADAIHLLGVLAHQMGKHEVAVEYIKRAIELQENACAFHNNLGEAYRALQRTAEAAASYRRALELKPDYAEAHNNLGNALRAQGKPDEAIACYRRALELKPDFAEACYNLGAALEDLGDRDEAAVCYRRALELKPNYAEASYNLGNLVGGREKLAAGGVCFRRALELRDQKDVTEEVALYRRALELNPDFAEAHNNLGNALRKLGKFDEAVVCLHRALELQPNFAEVYFNLGITFHEQRHLDKAVACYRRALELKPDFAEAHSDLGSALEQIGDLRGSEDAFRAALRHNPRFTLAHYKLAEILGGRVADNDLAVQRRLLADRALTDSQQFWLHFALARVLDARGQYAQAAEHAALGNALQRSERRKDGHVYDSKHFESLVIQMIEICTPDFFDHVRGFGLESEVPVFIVGLPRSGTTLVEQILASHSQVFGAGELQLADGTMAALGGQSTNSLEGLRRLNRHTAHRLAGPHLQKLHAFNPAALRIVDKMPEKYVYLGLLACLFRERN